MWSQGRRRLPPALQHRDYALLWSSALSTGLGIAMVAVAIGWQVYALHHDPLELGLVGLAEFGPLPLLALPAGVLADRLSRRAVYAVSIVLDAGAVVLLLVVSLSGARSLWPYLVAAAGTGVASAVGSPAVRALAPALVPTELLSGALALRSMAGQAAVVAGPAIGGVLFSLRPEVVYATAIGLYAVSLCCALALRSRGATERVVAAGEEQPRLETVLGGVRFMRKSPVVLGAILLDLFAVLFGGAVALLPLFAQSILHTGPIGLGLLRSAPAVGALAAGVMLTRRPLGGRAGQKLLLVVAVFGASMVVFGLSRSFALSLGALAVSGFVDMISMNIRATTVALATPDALRGRVNAVEMVFISASNELGAFESGVAAALVGAVPAVVAGGIATVVIALVWTRLFPSLARVDRLESLVPEAV